MKIIAARGVFKKTTLFATAFVLAVSTLTAAVPFILSEKASAVSMPYSQSFENGTNDWTNSTVEPNGADGFDASDGSHYARVSSGAFTQWGGYKNAFPQGGYSTSLDLFLYMNTANNGADLHVDYSSAINNQNGDHLRDFIFTLGTDPTTANQWLVNVGSNAPGNSSAANNLAINEDGWYTLKHDFIDNDGVLQVKMSVIKKSTGAVLKTWTLSNPSDLISTVVGGNRYGWFTGNRFDIPYVAIDNAKLVLNYTTPTEVYVDDDYTSTSTGGHVWNYDAFSSIQQALNVVAQNGIVNVAAGTFDGALTISKPVTLKGAQAGVDARNRTSSESVLTTSANANINVNASNVVVDGFTFNGPAGDSAAVSSIGSYSGSTIKNNIINNSSRAVIFSTSSTTLLQNRVNNVGAAAISGFEENSSAANNVVIENNDFYNGTNNNTDINFIGVQGTASNGLVVKGNRSINGASFLGVTNTNGAVVTNNVVTGSPKYGIFLGGANVNITIDANTIANANPAGAAIVVVNAFGYGLNSDVEGHNNNFEGSVNGTAVYPDGIAANQRARFGGNWWGSANGPVDPVSNDGSLPLSNNGSGAGAHGVVKYNSWCVNAACTLYSDSTLTAPTDLTPVSGSVTTDKDFKDTWKAVDGAASYEYQTSYSSNGTTLGDIIYSDSSKTNPSKYNLSNSTVTRANSGTPDGTYYWQVRAVNAEGIVGPWSAINSVTVDTANPNAPVAQSPSGWTDGATAFSWSAPADNGSKLHYEVQYSRTHPNNIAENGTLTSDTTTLAVTLADGPLFWRVRAVDAANNVSAWSDQAATIDTTAPVLTPSLKGGFVSGTRDISLNIDEPYLKASAIRIVKSDFSSVSATPGVSDQTGTKNPLTYSWNTTLVDNGAYKIQYTARDILGHSTTEFYDVVVDNGGPSATGVPSTTSPTRSVTNTWTWAAAIDTTSGIKGYEYQINDGAWTYTTDTTVTTAAPTSNGSYALSVRAIDNADNRGPATTGNVSVDTTGPGVTVEDSTSATNQPTLTGTVGSDAESVAITVFDEDGAIVEEGVADYIAGETAWSYTLADALSNGNYTIIATAVDGLGNKTDSAEANVVVAVLPADTTTSTTPVTATLSSSTPTPIETVQTTITTPAITSPAATAGVLGTATQNATNSDSAVEGTSSENKAADAVNSEANKGTFMGLGWYWWILILAAIAALVWWIAAAARRRQSQN